MYCKIRGVKPTNACAESGAGKNFIVSLKHGQTPGIDKFEKLAAYLDTTVSALLGETKKEPDTEGGDGLPKDAPAGADEDTRVIWDLLGRLTPANREKAFDHLEYLLARQEGGEGKK